MVSLRTKIWRLRQLAALATGATILLGVGLTMLAASARMFHAPSPAHSASSSLNLGDGSFDLVRANRAVYLATKHSDDRRIALTENWLQWSLGQLYRPLLRTQNAERLLAGSLANCSERSQILKSLAEKAGHQCRFVGLTGHVVLEVETAAGWQVADPDYGIVYPFGIEKLERAGAANLIRSTLSRSSYPPATIELYVSIVQSADDNVIMPIGSPLSPRLAVVETWCELLALPLPLGMIFCGVLLLYVTDRQRWAGFTRGRRELPAHTARGWSWGSLFAAPTAPAGERPDSSC